MKYADVIVDISHEKLDRIFQYSIPKEWEDKNIVGHRVLIPFGKSNRQINGYVVNISDTTAFDKDKIKQLISVDEKQIGIDSKMIALAYMIKERYGGTINDSLKTVLPVKKIVKSNTKKYIRLNITKEEYEALVLKYSDSKKYKARFLLLKEFEKEKVIEQDFITDRLGISKSVIASMQKDGIIDVESQIQYRNPICIDEKEESKIMLSDIQLGVANHIKGNIDRGVCKNYLIHGVTGSGKTQVYIEIIEHVVKNGKKAIMLIPEIALTYQTVKRFQKMFGNRVSIMNSRLSAGERYDQYLKAKNGEIDVMIGPRSALFTPFENLGLIVIDEEHEGSYKSESQPCYDTRQVAIMLAKMSNCSVVLGSATPSLVSYYKAQKGEYELLTLPDRVNGASFPKVYVEDLREEMKNGNKTIFSDRLDSLIKQRLQKKEQIMLFINRRGYSGFVSCRSCGYIVKCPHCDVSLTYHSTGNVSNQTYTNNGKLVCHYCGYETASVDTCPKCSSKFISIFGTGTQKVEAMARAKYPMARILRMDADTTKSKNGHQAILEAFSKGEADILIGTQMIVKGHDFPNVTLVGVLAADLSLGSNDYNAAENTFQILLQAAGRAGRANKPGEVVIQTYRPDHYSVESAAKRDYNNFYVNEMMSRRLMGYPPVVNMLSILVMCKNEEKNDKVSKWLVNGIKNGIEDDNKDIVVLGPTDALITKINDLYRKVIYIKHPDESYLAALRNKLQQIIITKEELKDCIINFDINPAHSI